MHKVLTPFRTYFRLDFCRVAPFATSMAFSRLFSVGRHGSLASHFLFKDLQFRPVRKGHPYFFFLPCSARQLYLFSDSVLRSRASPFKHGGRNMICCTYPVEFHELSLSTLFIAGTIVSLDIYQVYTWYSKAVRTQQPFKNWGELLFFASNFARNV